MRAGLTVCALLLPVVPVASGGVFVTGRFAPAESRDGFDIFELTAVSTVGDIWAFDFEGDRAVRGDLGIFGTMNNLNPFGLPTVFSNNNNAISGTGGDPRLDSQFLFNGVGDGTPSVTVPDGFAREESGLLAATFASPTPLGNRVPFARVVVPEGTQFQGRGIVVAGPDFQEFPLRIPGFPEPTSSWLALCWLATLLRQRERRSTTHSV